MSEYDLDVLEAARKLRVELKAAGERLGSELLDELRADREEPSILPGETTKPSPPGDLVNHPPHYTSSPSGVECIAVVEHMTFNIGNAVKYLWRAGLKGHALEDYKKAIWYIEREITRLTVRG